MTIPASGDELPPQWSIISRMSDAVVCANDRGTTFWNPAAERLFGCAVHEMHCSPLDAIFPAGGLINQPEGAVERCWRHEDGTETQLEISIARWIERGQACQVAVVRDVSARHREQQERLENERRFRLLVKGVVEYAIYMLDPNGMVTNWNAGAERIKGYTAEEIVGQHFGRFYTEEDRASGLPITALATAKREGKFEAEGWRVRKNGDRFWAEVVIDVVHDDHGQIIGFSKVTHDTTEKRLAQLKLLKSERRLKAFAEMAADWFWEQDAELRFVADANIPRMSQPTDVGKTRWDVADPAMAPHRWDEHKAALAARKPFRDFRWERIATTGERRYLSTSGDPIFTETGEFVGYYGTGRDITTEVAAKERAEQAETLLRDAVDSMSEGFVIYDRDDRFIMCNETYRDSHRRLDPDGADCLIAGAHIEDILRHTLAKGGVDEAARGHETEWLAEQLREYHRAEGSSEQRLNDGSWFLITHRRMENGGVAGLRVDITERKRSEERVAHLAHHDALTGLPNRTLLNDRLSQALNMCARNGEGLAVLALDLNHFKAVNDGFGHAAGDGLLRLIGDRLTGALRPSDTLARVGGDEFVVILNDVDAMVAGELAQRLIEVLMEPFQLHDLRMRIGTSIGIALYPCDGDNAEALLKNADTALYRAKTNRQSTFCFFEPHMDLRLRERWALEQELRLAIGSGQLRLQYQPTFAASTRAIVGFEALLRWQHPVRGDIPPMSFISIAEETGLIVTIGGWVLEEACRTAASWPSPKRIAVNLSAAQLGSGDLPAQVADILRRTGLPAGRLELEVTETMLISNHGQVLDTLRELREMGVQIACDDFGTGYSSFAYIQNLAFDRIKIDQSFVRELGMKPTAPRIVQAIVALARSLDMQLTAEGVETEEQLDMLRDLGCDEIQGFLLGRPMPGEAVSAALQSPVAAGGVPLAG